MALSDRSLDVRGPLDLRRRAHLGLGRLQDGVTVVLRPGGWPASPSGA